MGKFPFLFVFFFLNKWIFHKPPHEFVHYRAHHLPHPHWHSPCDQPREPATSPRRRLAEPRPPRNTTLPDVVVVGVAGPVSVPPLTAHRLSHFQFVFVNANSEYDTRPDGEKKKRGREKSRGGRARTQPPPSPFVCSNPVGENISSMRRRDSKRPLPQKRCIT